MNRGQVSKVSKIAVSVPISIGWACGQSRPLSGAKSLSDRTSSHAVVDLCFDLKNAQEGRTFSLHDQNISVTTPRMGRYPGMNVAFLSKYMKTSHDQKIIEYDSGPVNVKRVTNEQFGAITVGYISALNGKAEIWRGAKLLSTQSLRPSKAGSDEFTQLKIVSPLGETFTEVRLKGTVVYLGSLCIGF